MTQPSATLRAAWQATEYRVDTDAGTLALRLDTPDPALAKLMQHAGVTCAAYITADNPFSRVASEGQNAAARTRLLRRVHAGGWACLPGLGIDPEGDHPGEHSLLVLGMARDEAISLGREFRQHAIVLIGADAVPRLQLLVSS